MQLALCEVSYCDFVVWTPKGLVTNRIQPDHSYFTEIKPKLDYFFTKFILPELLTRYLQHPSPLISPQDDPPLAPSQDNDPPPQNIYCYCRQGEDGRQMIGCDNHNCPYQWFHFECVGLSRQPRPSTGTVLIAGCSTSLIRGFHEKYIRLNASTNCFEGAWVGGGIPYHFCAVTLFPGLTHICSFGLC